jgi:hypothetical protein
VKEAVVVDGDGETGFRVLVRADEPDDPAAACDLSKSSGLSPLQDQRELDLGLELQGFGVVHEHPRGRDIASRGLTPFGVPDWPVPDGQIQRKAVRSHDLKKPCDCTMGADRLLSA